MFADDTSLLCHNTDMSILKMNINNDLTLLSNWLKANKLSLNVEKSHYMIFSRKKDTPHDVDLRINEAKICRVNNVKFLGIIVDESLNWRHHISHICKKLSKCIAIMYKIRSYIDVNTSISLYYTLFYSYLTYCNIVWGNSCKSYLKPIVLLQKKMIRVTAGNRIYLEHTDPLFQKTKIMKFPVLHRYIVARFMFEFHYLE